MDLMGILQSTLGKGQSVEMKSFRKPHTGVIIYNHLQVKILRVKDKVPEDGFHIWSSLDEIISNRA
jgi:hypothetical protein